MKLRKILMRHFKLFLTMKRMQFKKRKFILILPGSTGLSKNLPKPLNYSKKALALAPDNRQILAEHYLNLGRILFTSGYDISAIIWLEKAEKLLETEKTSSDKLDTYRFLALAWWAKLNYQTALKYTGKWEIEAENTQFK